MINGIKLSDLQTMASGQPIDNFERFDARAWCERAISNFEGWHCELAQDDGYGTYVEVFIGPPSCALVLRKSYLGPFVAIGQGRYSLYTPGALQSWTGLCLSNVDVYDPQFQPVVAKLDQIVQNDGLRRLLSAELETRMPSGVAERVNSMLPMLEERREIVLFDVIFQWQD